MRESRLTATAVLLLAAVIFTSVSARAATVQDIRTGRHSDKTRLVFDLSEPVRYSVRTLASPHRLVIDIPGVDSWPSPHPTPAGTPISGLELSATAAGGLQVTLLLSHAVTTESFLLPSYQERGDRLVVDIYDTAADESLTAAEDTTRHTVAKTVGPRKLARPASVPVSARKTVSRSVASPAVEHGPQFNFSGTWEQEWAYQTEKSGNQKFEALVEPRLDVNFASGSQLTTILRIRLDAVGDLGPFEDRSDNYSEVNGPIYNDEYAELSLREFYLDTEWANVYWRLGKQQVVWGQADGIKVLDVVNPQSFREFILDDFDDSRIPLWMINAELPLDEGGLQLLWMPDTTYHELAEVGSSFFLTSPKWVPTIPADTFVRLASFDKPDSPLKDSDLGARYTAFAGGWDISLNYLYHYQDYPVFYQQPDKHNGVDSLKIAPTYKRNNLFGGTLSNVFDELTLRAELAYSTDTYHTTNTPLDRGIKNSSEIASVIGLDWHYTGDGLLSAQWFSSYLPDYSKDIVRDENENTVSLLFQKGFANETWQLRVLGLYSLNDEDSLLELRLKYWLLGNLELWIGGDFFHGSQRGTFGQFDKQSRVLLGMEYGF